jgi:hypothetical protein
MSYIINLTNGNVYATVQDGTTNTNSGLTLVGRNFTGYGTAQNQNFVHLLENFADTIPPTNSSNATVPLIGTLWYDTVNQRIKVYDGVNWDPVSERFVSNVAPTSVNYTIKTGDQWYDTVNQQVNTWTGSSWLVVGPLNSSALGVSGTIPGTITDSNNTVHIVANTYTNGNLVTITSYDAAFTPSQGIYGFPTINPGVNLINTSTLTGNVTNANTVGFISPTSFARNDEDNVFVGNLTTPQNLTLGTIGSSSYANIHFSGSDNLVVHNHAYQGNVHFYVTNSNGNVTTMSISGPTGLVSVLGDPTANLGVATKQYVDNSVGAQVQDVQNVANQFYASIEALQADYLANVNIIDGAISSVVSSTNANLASAVSAINATNAASSAAVSAYETWANATLSSQQSQITSANTYVNVVVPTLAPINSPTFTGTPKAPSVSALLPYLSQSLSFSGVGDYSTAIPTTQYVDVTANILWGDYTTRIAALNSSLSGGLNTGLLLKANLSGATFTGTIYAPTATALTWNTNNNTPASGTQDTTVATASFVEQSIANQKINYTVSTNAPSGGNNGDFWYQIIG